MAGGSYTDNIAVQATIANLGPDKKVQDGVIIAECAVTVLLFLGFWWIAGRQETLAARLGSKQISTAQFSVQLRGLPKDGVTTQAVREFCAKRWGEVVDVALVLDGQNLIDLRQERESILLNLQKRQKSAFSTLSRSTSVALPDTLSSPSFSHSPARVSTPQQQQQQQQPRSSVSAENSPTSSGLVGSPEPHSDIALSRIEETSETVRLSPFETSQTRDIEGISGIERVSEFETDATTKQQFIQSSQQMEKAAKNASLFSDHASWLALEKRLPLLWAVRGHSTDYLIWRLSEIDAAINTLLEKGRFQCTGRCFVTFNAHGAAVSCKNDFQHERCGGCCGAVRFRGRRLRMAEPSEPSDILWENMPVSLFRRVLCQFRSVILSANVVSAGMVSASFLLIISDSIYVSMMVGFLIALVNRFLDWILSKIVVYEYHHSISGYMSGLTSKSFFLAIFERCVHDHGSVGVDPCFPRTRRGMGEILGRRGCCAKLFAFVFHNVTLSAAAKKSHAVFAAVLEHVLERTFSNPKRFRRRIFSAKLYDFLTLCFCAETVVFVDYSVVLHTAWFDYCFSNFDWNLYS
eukprot:TRINITY_DN4264_c0_g1_i1.p1 TRINITY_DN4264_c0_g1~~TRINITY_DN4264_c0_g1_i1.p1  ORF type:complete len:671 (-),score=129.98 TRINITY_DN4264_c0_g1_i1:324-2054(-)